MPNQPSNADHRLNRAIERLATTERELHATWDHVSDTREAIAKTKALMAQIEMVHLPDPRQSLSKTTRHLAEAEERVARQQALLEQMPSDSQNKDVAAEVLKALQDTVEAARLRQAQLLREYEVWFITHPDRP